MSGFNSVSYFNLITWGSIHGLVAYGLLVWLAHQWWRDWLALVVLIFLGGVISAFVFVPLYWKWARGLIPGFVLASCLLPFVAVIGGDSLHYGYLYIGGPVTLGFAGIWAILLLPFAVLAAIVYQRMPRFPLS